MVKRVSTGLPSVTLPNMPPMPPVGFLKIKFSDVLIIGLDWDDGDMINETCKFICRGFDLFYRRQNDDGSLDNTTYSASWKWDRNAQGGG